MGKIGRVMGRMATNTILVQPIRILIIINSIFLPLLLGTLVFIILKYAQDIKGIIDKAQKIEGMVEDNINKGIQLIKEKYAKLNKNFTKENAETFIKDTLLKPLISYINPAIYEIDKKVNDEYKNAIDFSKIKLYEFTTLLDVSGQSVNDIIKSNLDLFLSVCSQEQINKVLSENRSIAYILTHNKLNN